MSTAARWGGGLALLAALVFAAFNLRGGWAEAPLVDVTGVERTVLERGQPLVLQGVGFRAGRPAEVRLRGQMKRPGAPSAWIDVVLVGRVITGERIEVTLDDAAYSKLGQRGSFEGAIDVGLAAARGVRVVSGRLAHARFDVLPGAGAAALEQQLRRQAADLLARLGVTPADADTLHGLSVAAVRPAGIADRAGLRAGDVIDAVGGVNVHALSDLAPPQAASRVELSVRRPGSDVPLRLSLRLDSGDLFEDPRLPLLLAFVLLTLAFLSPLPSPTTWLLRAAAAQRVAGSRPRALVAGLVMTFVLCAAWVSAGSAHPSVLAAQQGVAPWCWKALTHPELLVGCAMYLAFSTVLIDRVPSRALRLLVRLSLSAAAVIVLLGGYAVPSQLPAMAATAIGAILFGVKVGALAWVLPRARVLVHTFSPVALLSWCVGIACATFGWLNIDAPQPLEALLGQTLALTLVGAAVVIALQVHETSARPEAAARGA